MDPIIKFSLFGIAVAMLILFIKSIQAQISPVVIIAGSVLLLGAVLKMAQGAISAISRLFEVSQLENESIKSILKIVGSAYIVDFAASVCRDIGESSVASKIELAGRVYIVLLSVPWASMLIEAVKTIGG